ncbi:MAG: tetratricopeptide repeat protein [Candidatus Krumholzibacteriota bacterium]|nr:tetratricopeptide repeat protein [Candidatus Krumholzibacteriota bacterium]
MLNTSGRTRRAVAGVACIVMLVISMALSGCGNEEGKSSRGIRVERITRDDPAKRATAEQPEVAAIAPAIEEAEPEAERVSAADREVSYEEAEEAYFEKRYAEATELFGYYTDRKSENPWGFFMLGLSAWKAKDYETAERGFQTAIRLDPNHVKSWLGMSRVLLDTGRPLESLETTGRALEIDSGSNDAFRLQGRACHQLGRSEEAIDAYRRAIVIDINDAWSMNNLALILIEEGRFDEALAPLARATELRDDIAVFQNNLGMALEHTGHFKAAAEAYASAVKIDESYEKAYENQLRVEGVVEDPGRESIDLVSLAASFAESIPGWEVAGVEESAPAAALTVPESAATATGSIASINPADSIAGGNDR